MRVPISIFKKEFRTRFDEVLKDEERKYFLDYLNNEGYSASERGKEYKVDIYDMANNKTKYEASFIREDTLKIVKCIIRGYCQRRDKKTEKEVMEKGNELYLKTQEYFLQRTIKIMDP